MNTALITVGKRLLGDNLFLVSVFDLEPSGVIIKAYNQTDSREYSLPISERELQAAGYNRTNAQLNELVDTLILKPLGEVLLLQSTNDLISIPKPPMTADQAQASIAECNAVLVTGLVELCKVKPVGLDAVQWLGDWLLNNNPHKPRVDLVDE